jgi:hypothetical protein
VQQNLVTTASTPLSMLPVPFNLIAISLWPIQGIVFSFWYLSRQYRHLYAHDIPENGLWHQWPVKDLVDYIRKDIKVRNYIIKLHNFILCIKVPNTL